MPLLSTKFSIHFELNVTLQSQLCQKQQKVLTHTSLKVAVCKQCVEVTAGGSTMSILAFCQTQHGHASSCVCLILVTTIMPNMMMMPWWSLILVHCCRPLFTIPLPPPTPISAKDVLTPQWWNELLSEVQSYCTYSTAGWKPLFYDLISKPYASTS